MGDQLVAETSTWLHTTLTTDINPCLRRNSRYYWDDKIREEG